ncbi:MAG: hypothetical protein FJ405_07595, partial [Verrucomicrobia bacterium]|nr:hypothetical protein [Verrucomicrobiota bacterium]
MKQARKQDLSTRPVLQVIALLACCLGFGCAGYKLGPTSGQVAGQRSVEILPIQNLTPEPRLTDAFDGALRRAIQHDGTFRLETRDEGDLIVSGVITRFQRSYLSFDPR